MRLTTLCYLEQDGKYLMLHRIVKKNDVNKDKWIGIGGKFEPGESPEDCVLREAREETIFFGELLGIRFVPLDVVVFFLVGYALSVVFEILLFLFQFGTLIYAQNVAFKLLVDFRQSVRFALVDADGRLAALRGIAGRAVCRLRRR